MLAFPCELCRFPPLFFLFLARNAGKAKKREINTVPKVKRNKKKVRNRVDEQREEI